MMMVHDGWFIIICFDLTASRMAPGLYTMLGYLVRQVRVKSYIVCFLFRHNVLMPRCMGDVGMTRCGDILDEPPSKNAVAAQIVYRIKITRKSSVLRIVVKILG